MTELRLNLGKSGEHAAIVYLKEHGYRILEKNFKNRLGEIDIIAVDQDVICFIEVKTRSSDDFGSPFEAVSKWKKHKMARVAQSYLKQVGCETANARFDVIAVISRDQQPSAIELLKNAFEVDSY